MKLTVSKGQVNLIISFGCGGPRLFTQIPIFGFIIRIASRLVVLLKSQHLRPEFEATCREKAKLIIT